MSFKGKDLAYDKAADDEPIFVLRAQDMLAPTVVRDWAARAHAAGSPQAKVQEALDCADQMDEWQNLNTTKVPD